jgi:hypothetical protein
MKTWRWFALTGVAALVIRAVRRHITPLVTQTIPSSDERAVPTDGPTRSTPADQALIFALARRLAFERAVHTDTGRLDCLTRAAEITLASRPLAARFVSAHGDSFLYRFNREPARRQPECQGCGASMHEASSYDAALVEWMPVWTCARCGGQMPR